MKGSELRDRERKKEVLQLFKPKKNGIFIHKDCPQKLGTRKRPRPGKVRVWTKEEIKSFV